MCIPDVHHDHNLDYAATGYLVLYRTHENYENQPDFRLFGILEDGTEDPLWQAATPAQCPPCSSMSVSAST